MSHRIFCIGCGRRARTITEAEYLGFVKGKKNRWRCGRCEASRAARLRGRMPAEVASRGLNSLQPGLPFPRW
jgi:hypothetical protein